MGSKHKEKNKSKSHTNKTSSSTSKDDNSSSSSLINSSNNGGSNSISDKRSKDLQQKESITAIELSNELKTAVKTSHPQPSAKSVKAKNQQLEQKQNPQSQRVENQKRVHNSKPHHNGDSSDNPPTGSVKNEKSSTEISTDGSIPSTNDKNTNYDDRKRPLQNTNNITNNNADTARLTKRQKIQKESDRKHKWQQMPKIQSPELRQKAYLRQAGFGSSTTLTAFKDIADNAKGKPNSTATGDVNSKDQDKDDSDSKSKPKDLPGNARNDTKKNDVIILDPLSSEMKFGRLLGSSDVRVRHGAILQLTQYLKARTDVTNIGAGGVSEMDLLKLWKALWYCLYMADRVVVQDELSMQIANLLFSLAGTEEEDEYAANAYLQITGDDDDDEDDDDDYGDDEDETENSSGAKDDIDEDDNDGMDDDSIDMEVIENTFDASDEEDENENNDDEDEDDDHDNGSLLEEDEDEDEDDDPREIRHCRGAHLASLFVRTFFQTIRREWGRMDKYRLDKFYTLMRYMMSNIYQYMASRHWNRGIVRLFNDAVYDEVLNEVPDGLRYHLVDVALDELVKVSNGKANTNITLSSSTSNTPLTEATFIDCLEPFFGVAQTGSGSRSNTLQKRVLENVLEKFLLQFSVLSDAALSSNTTSDQSKGTREDRKGTNSKDEGTGNKKDDETSITHLIFHDVHVGTVADFIFELASDPETLDMYRKALYDVHKLYKRRLQLYPGRDVDIDGSDEVDGDSDAIMEDNCKLKEGCSGCGGSSDKEKDNQNKAVTANENDKSSKKRKKSGVKPLPDSTINDLNHKENKLIGEPTDSQTTSKVATTEEKMNVDDNTEHHSKKDKKKKKKKKRSDSDASDTTVTSSDSNSSDINKDKNKHRNSAENDKSLKRDKSDASITDNKGLHVDDQDSTKKRKETLSLSSSMQSKKSTKNDVKKFDDRASESALTPSSTSILSKKNKNNKNDFIKETASSLVTTKESKAQKTTLEESSPSKKHLSSVVATKESTTQRTTSEESSPSKKNQKSFRKTDEEGMNGTTASLDATSIECSNNGKEQVEEVITITLKQQKDAKKAMKQSLISSNKKIRSGEDSDVEKILYNICKEKKNSHEKLPNKKSKKKDDPSRDIHIIKEKVNKNNSTNISDSVKGGSGTKSTDTPAKRTTGRKRVKFAELNRARSYDVSIKNLCSMESPVKKGLTPECSILRKKQRMHEELLFNAKNNKQSNKQSSHFNNSSSNSNNSKQIGNKGQRKKAIEYF